MIIANSVRITMTLSVIKQVNMNTNVVANSTKVSYFIAIDVSGCLCTHTSIKSWTVCVVMGSWFGLVWFGVVWCGAVLAMSGGVVRLDTDGSHAAEELVSGDTAEQLSKDVRDKVSALDLLCHPHTHGDGRVEGSAADCSAEQNGECEGGTDCVCVSGGEDHVDQGECADELNDKLLHLIVGIHKKLMTRITHNRFDSSWDRFTILH